MKINKIINNNIVSSYDNHNREIIIMGRGLGFGQKAGNEVTADKIEKIFRMDSQDELQQLTEILYDSSFKIVQLVTRIIQDAKESIKDNIQRTIYITLIDHINFALERKRRNLEIFNPLTSEVKRFFPIEYQVGKDAVKSIQDHLSVELPEDEAASIALHFVNAEYGKQMNETYYVTKVLKDVVRIIQYNYTVELDVNSLHYERFISHMKFLMFRIVDNELLNGKDDFLNKMIKEHYPKAYGCAQKITALIEKDSNRNIPADETTFIAIHIERITNEPG